VLMVIECVCVCVCVCVSFGSRAIPPGLPQATVWVIRVHVRGLTHLSGRETERQLTSLSLSLSLPLSLSTSTSTSPLYLPECQPIGTVQGLDIMSAGYHYMYYFFPPDRLALVCSWCFWGYLSLLVRD